MKQVLLVLGWITFALCQFAVPREDMAKLLKFNTQCQKQSEASQQEILATMQNKFSDSIQLKNHVFCMGVKLRFIDENGQLQIENIRTKLSRSFQNEDEIEFVISKCLKQKSDPVDTAYEAIKCVSNNHNNDNPSEKSKA